MNGTVRHIASQAGVGVRQLRSLLTNQRGNAAVLMAVAIFPTVAIIGGALDFARSQLVRSRLSEACDSSALAGRRAMSNEDINTAKPEATKFFNFNFPQGYLSSASVTPVITRPETGTVKVDASTSVPMTLMKIFGYSSVPVSVSCTATQNFDNIDIVLVLDVTGSMDQSINGEKKIVGLRKAVMALYDELDAAQTELQAQGLRLRYAIVPYSMTVNVGKLVRAVNSDYIANTWTYQSRSVSCANGNCWFTYGPKSVDVSSYASGSSVNVSPIIGGSNNWVTWNGCIEERKTVSTITSTTGTSYSDIPPGAYDLDIDRVPDGSHDTKWGPHFSKIVFWPNHSSPRPTYCPKEAKRLNAMTRSDMQTYVDSLVPTGGTYHDIGMIWGARFISRGGIFQADNPSTYNDRPVNRYVIFMTDGDLAPNSDHYVAYGVEQLDRRVVGGTYGNSVASGNGSDLEKRHTVRFLMACNAAKQGGASVWSLGFSDPDDISVIEPLQKCASNEDQFALSTNSTDLIDKFKEIGKNIGALRLEK